MNDTIYAVFKHYNSEGVLLFARVASTWENGMGVRESDIKDERSSCPNNTPSTVTPTWFATLEHARAEWNRVVETERPVYCQPRSLESAFHHVGVVPDNPT